MRKELYKLIEQTSFSPDIFFDRPEGIKVIQGEFQNKIDNINLLLGLNKKKYNLEVEICILCCCFLDGLARISYEKRNSQVRFLKLLYDYGRYKNIDFHKVSLITLRDLLLHHKSNASLFASRLDIINKEIDKIDYSLAEFFKREPLKKNLLRRLAKTTKKDFDKIKEATERATYASVLYNEYRCQAVHEAIITTYWVIDTNEEDTLISDDSAQLVFTPKFLVGLCKKIFKDVFNELYKRVYAR